MNWLFVVCRALPPSLLSPPPSYPPHPHPLPHPSHTFQNETVSTRCGTGTRWKDRYVDDNKRGLSSWTRWMARPVGGTVEQGRWFIIIINQRVQQRKRCFSITWDAFCQPKGAGGINRRKKLLSPNTRLQRRPPRPKQAASSSLGLFIFIIILVTRNVRWGCPHFQ